MLRSGKNKLRRLVAATGVMLMCQPLGHAAVPMPDIMMPASLTVSADTNRAIVQHAFDKWAAGQGAFYDLLSDDAIVTVSGQSRRSGTFTKQVFLRELAGPFTARFSSPITPTVKKIWAVGDEVIVLWDSSATVCDGRLYTNSYAYFLTMKGGRAIALTMFLDMAAYDDVWARCRPTDQPQH